jgi:hypothetical protein
MARYDNIVSMSRNVLRKRAVHSLSKWDFLDLQAWNEKLRQRMIDDTSISFARGISRI